MAWVKAKNYLVQSIAAYPVNTGLPNSMKKRSHAGTCKLLRISREDMHSKNFAGILEACILKINESNLLFASPRADTRVELNKLLDTVPKSTMDMLLETASKLNWCSSFEEPRDTVQFSITAKRINQSMVWLLIPRMNEEQLKSLCLKTFNNYNEGILTIADNMKGQSLLTTLLAHDGRASYCIQYLTLAQTSAYIDSVEKDTAETLYGWQNILQRTPYVDILERAQKKVPPEFFLASVLKNRSKSVMPLQHKLLSKKVIAQLSRASRSKEVIHNCVERMLKSGLYELSPKVTP